MDEHGDGRSVFHEGRETAAAWMSFAIGFQLGNDYPLRVTVFRSFVINVSTSLSLVVPRPNVIEFGGEFVDTLRISVGASLPRDD